MTFFERKKERGFEKPEDLSVREIALLKLIDIQAKEIKQLGMQVESLRYNKRFTNTKYVKREIGEQAGVKKINKITKLGALK